MAQDLLGLVKRRADLAGDEPAAGHDLGDAAAQLGLELHVAVGDDAHQLAVLVHDGHAGDAVLGHQGLRVAERLVRREGEGIRDDAVFRTLDQVDLLGLHVDGHVLVDNADAALARDGDGHAVLGDGVHRGAHDRDVQTDFFCQIRGQIHVGGQDIALRRDQQHVVKGQAFADNTLGILLFQLHTPLLVKYDFTADRGHQPQ